MTWTYITLPCFFKWSSTKWNTRLSVMICTRNLRIQSVLSKNCRFYNLTNLEIFTRGMIIGRNHFSKVVWVSTNSTLVQSCRKKIRRKKNCSKKGTITSQNSVLIEKNLRWINIWQAGRESVNVISLPWIVIIASHRQQHLKLYSKRKNLGK